MKLAKRLSYKLIIVLCIIATFCSFVASAPVYASKVNKSDFYYSGVQKGSYTIDKKFTQKLVEALDGILDYLLGICTMGIKMVFIGWTALFERCLTWILSAAVGEPVDVDGTSATNLFSAEGWVTLDAIFFNHIPLLDVNFFNPDMIEGYDAVGSPKANTGASATATPSGGTTGNKNLVMIFKEAIASWYYVLRTISIMVMLVLLMYIGIKLAITSSVTDKAVYKKMLMDWLVGMILVFSIHYIMLFIINFNEVMVGILEDLRTTTRPLAVYEYGLEERAQREITNEELELTLYDEVKTRAYDVKLTVGTSGMIMYMVLVYYAWKYTFIYLKRYLTIAALTIIAPLIAVYYAYNKVRSGKATVFSKWLKEYTFITILQSIHALIYLVFIQTSIAISLSSISGFILSFVLLNFASKSEGIFRKIFGITGGGNGLTDDIANGKGIRDTVNNLKGAFVGMAGAKVAVGYTKTVGRIATKPIRVAGVAGFNSVMRARAKKLDQKAIDYATKHHRAEGQTNDKKSVIRDYGDLKKALRKRRVNVLHFGKILKEIENGNLNIDEIEEEVNSLQIGSSIVDINGTYVGTVTEKYIETKKKELEELKAIQNMTTEEKEEWIEEYDALHDKKGNLKQLRIYLSDKWEDIMDPTLYTEKAKDSKGNLIKDKNGNQVFKTIETETEYGAVHSSLFGKEFTWRFGKKIDGASYRLSNQLKWDNISGLNAAEKKAIKAQKDLIKNEIMGFTGILTGLPLLVAQPAAGMTAMAVGIANAKPVLSSVGFKERKAISHYKIDERGKYTFNKFEGKSSHTIAEGAKVMARRQVYQISKQHIIHDEKMKKRIKVKYPKISNALIASANRGEIGYPGTDKHYKLATNVGAVATTLSVGTLAMVGGAPAFVAGIGVASATVEAVGKAKFTGTILNRAESNAWLRYQATIKASKKAENKKLEKDEKAAGTADYMNVLADNYFQMEHDEASSDATRHAQLLGDTYAVLLLTMQENVDQKTDEEVVRDSNYESPIEVTQTPAGRPQISLDAENKLIDDAIIECARKCGIMNIADFNVDIKFNDIESMIKTYLLIRGVMQKNEQVDAIIQNLRSKVKDRKLKLDRSGKSKTVVEEKIAGEAIVSVMQTKGITDVSKVSDKEVLEKYIEIYKTDSSETTQSSEQSNAVLEGLNAQRGNEDSASAPIVIDMEAIRESATEAIQAKKAEFIDFTKQAISKTEISNMKSTIKRRQEFELDKAILETQSDIENVSKENGVTVQDIMQERSETILAVAGLSNKKEELARNDLASRREIPIVNEIKQKSNATIDAKLDEEISNIDSRQSTVNYSDVIANENNQINSRYGKTSDRHTVDTETINQMTESINQGKQRRAQEAIPTPTEDTQESPMVGMFSDVLFNENGGINSNNDGSSQVVPTVTSDDIINMLQIQTQLHKDKQKIAVFEGKIPGNRDKKVSLYQDLISNDGLEEINGVPKRSGDLEIGTANPRNTKAGSRKNSTNSNSRASRPEQINSRRINSVAGAAQRARGMWDGTKAQTYMNNRTRNNSSINMNTEISEILRKKKQEINNMGMGL